MTTQTDTFKPEAIVIDDLLKDSGIQAASGMTMVGYKDGHPFMGYVPPQESNHKLPHMFLREYRSWHNNPGERGFYMAGPTGCGKTSGIMAINSFLNIPTLLVGCHRDMTKLELIGTMGFAIDPETKQSVTRYVLGPVARAFKFGFTLILDELNLLDPGVSAGLNELIRGKTLVIEETGEVIRRHPMFRAIATSNDWGRGDGARRLAGIQQQNAAFLGRWWLYEATYPSTDEEVSILAAKYPAVPVNLLEGMVNVADRLRQVIVGVAKGDDADRATLDVDFSTRTLINWADGIARFAKAGNPVEYGLEIALLRSCSASEKQVIERACMDVMGNLYKGGQDVQ